MNFFAKTLLSILILVATTAAHAQNITRTVRAGGAVHLINASVYNVLRCHSQPMFPDARLVPKYGSLVTRIFHKDLSHICKQMLFNAVVYQAGRERGVDKFTLYLQGDGETMTYEVTVHVR